MTMTDQTSRLILLEFNELCPRLIQDFMQQGVLPHFRRLYESSLIFTTDAGEEPPNLEPWIQWPTVHSGLPFSEHKAFHLGDGRKLERKCLAEVLADAGVPAGVFGSMNLNYTRLNGYVVPDPWDKEGVAQPDWVAPFYRTVSRQVQESSQGHALSKKELAGFGLFLLGHGLSLRTARALLSQLLHERWDPGVRWRRASLLDHLQYDVFRSLNRRLGVRFATFFCNSTAHFQHYYWRNMRPEQFEAPVPATDHPSLKDAIPYGYRSMDALLGRFLRDYPDDVLHMCTALSQQPWTDTTKCTFRPKSFEALLEFAGIAAATALIKPVMAEQFHIECQSDEAADWAEARLRDLTVDDEPLMNVERTQRNLFTGCRMNDPGVRDRPVTRPGHEVGPRFSDLFAMVHTMRSGRHHPDGVLWIRTGRHQVSRDKVPLTDIAPTILKHFGVPQPEYMKGQPLAVGSSRPSYTFGQPLAV